MNIPVGCQCGATFAANPTLAGKTVKCPTCGSSISIPKSAEPERVLVAQCDSCGKKYKVLAKNSGKVVRCSCGQQFTVGTNPTSNMPAAADLLEGLNDPLATPSTAATRSLPASPLAPANSGSAQDKGPSTSTNWKLIGSIGFGVVVVIAVIAIVAVVVSAPKGYRTPQAAFDAQKKAEHAKDWRTMFQVLTPESQDQTVAAIAMFAQMGAAQDKEIARILERHGVKSQALESVEPKSLADLSNFAAKLKSNMDTMAESISCYKEGARHSNHR